MVGFDAIVKGEVVVDQGFTDFTLVDAVAVLTVGFLFACNDFWINPNLPVITNWSADASVSTSWADVDPVITTTWAPDAASTTTWTDVDPVVTTTWATPTGGIYGDC